MNSLENVGIHVVVNITVIGMPDLGQNRVDAGVSFLIGEVFMPPLMVFPGADAVVPPPEAGPPPEDLPADGDELPSPPTAIPPPGDETTSPAELSRLPNSIRTKPFFRTARPWLSGKSVESSVQTLGPVWSDALVPSCSDAPASKSIFKGETKCRDRGVKLNCHKQIVCAVIETRRNHEKRADSMLPNTFFTTWSP
jgi:hypothetical protein